MKIENDTKKDLVVIITLIITTLIFIFASGYFVYAKEMNGATELYLKGNKIIKVEAGSEYIDEGVIAVINGKNVENKVIVSGDKVDTNKLGIYTIKYNLIEPKYAISKEETRTIIVEDTTAPEITIDSEENVKLNIGDKFETPTCVAVDNLNGEITNRVKVNSNVNLEKNGDYKIVYTVKDSSGNEAKKTINVQVKKKKNPYIVVSISKQKLTYYEYDEPVLTSNVVTGINGKTPKGTFKVLNKATDIILKGKDYESFVNYWIAFSGASFGFHDASWRSNFGGKIYKTNGSHGCVNMPYNKVKQLYKMVSVGTPVYINK